MLNYIENKKKMLKINKNKLAIYLTLILLLLAIGTVIWDGLGILYTGSENIFYNYFYGRIMRDYQPIEYKAKQLSNLPVEAIISRVWGDEAKTAIMVSWAENGARKCDLEVLEPNNSTSYGIFMLNSVHFKKGYTEADFKDCVKNVQIAKKFYDEAGWHLWTAWKNKSYLAYKK